MAKKIAVIEDQLAAKLEDAIRRVLSLKGGPGIRVSNTSAGITISLAGERPYNPRGPVPNDGTWVKIIGPGTLVGSVIKYSWIQQRRTASGWTNTDTTSTDGTGGTTDTRATNAHRLNGRTYFQPNRVVRLWSDADSDGNSAPNFQLNDADFSVVVAFDGGSDGAAPSTGASWTYTVKDETGATTLKKNNAGDDATAMSPDMARLRCKTNKATRGLARYQDDGTLVLVWVDETPTFGLRNCP